MSPEIRYCPTTEFLLPIIYYVFHASKLILGEEHIIKGQWHDARRLIFRPFLANEQTIFQGATKCC
jgi:hypothetical protein